MSREIAGGGGKKLSRVCPLSCVKMTRYSEIVPKLEVGPWFNKILVKLAVFQCLQAHTLTTLQKPVSQ